MLKSKRETGNQTISIPPLSFPKAILFSPTERRYPKHQRRVTELTLVKWPFLLEVQHLAWRCTGQAIDSIGCRLNASLLRKMFNYKYAAVLVSDHLSRSAVTQNSRHRDIRSSSLTFRRRLGGSPPWQGRKQPYLITLRSRRERTTRGSKRHRFVSVDSDKNNLTLKQAPRGT